MPIDYPEDMPRDLIEAAEDTDDAIGAEIAELIPPPASPYNVKVLNALAKAIAAVGKVMGLDLGAGKLHRTGRAT